MKNWLGISLLDKTRIIYFGCKSVSPTKDLQARPDETSITYCHVSCKPESDSTGAGVSLIENHLDPCETKKMKLSNLTFATTE